MQCDSEVTQRGVRQWRGIVILGDVTLWHSQVERRYAKV